MISFSVIPPARSNPQRYIKMCVISPHNSAGIVIIMWCQIVKLSPAPDDTYVQRELELFQIDRFARSYDIQKLLLRCREILKFVQNLISPLFAIRKSARTTFSRRGLFEESRLFQNLYDASEPIEKNGHLTCFAEHAVSISTFLDTQESFQSLQRKAFKSLFRKPGFSGSPEVKDMCGGGF